MCIVICFAQQLVVCFHLYLLMPKEVFEKKEHPHPQWTSRLCGE